MNGKTTANDRRSLRAPLLVVNLTAFLIGVAVIAVVLNYFGGRASMRLQLDATKTRAYSLSERTQQLLDDLTGDWTIAIVLVEDNVDRDAQRQVNEVLRRFEKSTDALSVTRVDPTDPATLDDYEMLLTQLRVIYQDRIDDYDRLIDAAVAATTSYAVFMQQQSGQWSTLRRNLDADDPQLKDIDDLLGIMAFRLQQATQVGAEIESAMRVDDTQPLRDYEAARSMLVAAGTAWSAELFGAAQKIDGWRQNAELNPLIRSFIAPLHDEFLQQSGELAIAVDPLKHVPPLELGQIGRAMQQGEVAVVLGPPGATIIPSAQLFPGNLRQGRAGVALDRRFRGEQSIAAAIRSLQTESLPHVIFVHPQRESMLRRRNGNIDLVGAADVLKSSRFVVEEWMVASMDRPVTGPDEPVVWIVFPPPLQGRAGIRPSDDEFTLIDATRALIADGESVLISVAPSRLPKYHHPDPWVDVFDPFGLSVETDRAVFERLTTEDGQHVNQGVLQVLDFEPGHPVAAAAHGLDTSFDLPIAIRPRDDALGSVIKRTVLAALDGGETRWLEDDWFDARRIDEPTQEQRFESPLPIAVAVERPDPLGEGTQRAIVVGSSGWAYSYIADVTRSIGGNRVALMSPGNYELLMASIAWLAGQEELIAPGALSQQVQRLDGVTPGARTGWGIGVMLLLPAMCLALGATVWFMRRT